MRTKTTLAALVAVALLAVAMLAVAAPAQAAVTAKPVTQTTFFYNGGTVRTTITTAALPNAGADTLYVFTNGVQGQLPVATVGPTSTAYHGGSWAVYLVSFTATCPMGPHLVTDAAHIQMCLDMGHMTATRAPQLDVRAPLAT